MKLLSLVLALCASAALSTPSHAQRVVNYGGGKHPAPAPPKQQRDLQAQAQQTHRRHHSRMASAVLEGIGKTGEAVKEAGRKIKRGLSEEEEGHRDDVVRDEGGHIRPSHLEDTSWVEPSLPSIAGNTTSTSPSAKSTSNRIADGPSFDGIEDEGFEQDLTIKKRQSSSCEKRQSQPLGWSLKGLTKNGVAFGFLPDDGSGGGQTESLEMIESKLGVKAAAQGWYAQVLPDKPFDGAQFEARKDQIRNSDGVFQATVMPVTWKGFTWDDNSQAVNVANYLQKWVDVGKEVWLRFAHEVNYYQKDGTYQGNVDDFKLAWSVMAKARDDLAPNVKMWFTPNFGDLYEYDKFYPSDPKTVDLIGIDWYPKQTSDFNFAAGPADMKKFHDKYTNDRVKFAIGEIGLGVPATLQQRLEWCKNVLDAKKVMPNMIAVSWFNYWKDNYSYKIVDDHGDDIVVNFFRET